MKDSEPIVGLGLEWAAYCLAYDLYVMTIPRPPFGMSVVRSSKTPSGDPLTGKDIRIRRALQLLAPHFTSTGLVELVWKLATILATRPIYVRGDESDSTFQIEPKRATGISFWKQAISEGGSHLFPPKLTNWGELGELIASVTRRRCPSEPINAPTDEIGRILQALHAVSPIPDLIAYYQSDIASSECKGDDNPLVFMDRFAILDSLIRCNTLGQSCERHVLCLDPGVLRIYDTIILFPINPVPPELIFLWLLMENPNEWVSRRSMFPNLARDPSDYNQYACAARKWLKKSILGYHQKNDLPITTVERNAFILGHRGTRASPGPYKVALRPAQVHLCHAWSDDPLPLKAPQAVSPQ